MSERKGREQRGGEKPELKDLAHSNNEIETKIINLGSKEEFITKIEAMGAKLSDKKRRIADTQFRIPKEFEPDDNRGLTYQIHNAPDPEETKRTLAYLGMEVIEPSEPNTIKCKPPNDVHRRAVRLRDEHSKTFLTVKEMRKDFTNVDDRKEYEIEIKKLDTVILILRNLGYKETSYREKERTTYTLVRKSENGEEEFQIDIDESPLKQVPAWAEIEGPSQTDVLALAAELGYTAKDIGGMSTTRYYELKGVGREKSKNIEFED